MRRAHVWGQGFRLCGVQAEAIKLNRPLLVVGTPGRLAEMSRMGVLQTHPTRVLVLDEV